MGSPVRLALPLAVVVGLVAATPAAAEVKGLPKAHAAGGAVAEVTYPTAVRTRVGRTERALERAIKKVEKGQPAEAATAFKVVRRQLAAAWRGARYIIRTTPPPPPPADDARVQRRGRAAGGAPAGPVYASPPETGIRVLALQHNVAGEVGQLIDGAHGTGLNALSTTLNFTLDRRDAAIKDILALAPPAPPVGDDARVRARKSDEDAAPTFDALMPTVVPDLDDEIQAIEALKADATDLTAGGKRVLNAAGVQIGKTKDFVNTTWPPPPAGD